MANVTINDLTLKDTPADTDSLELQEQGGASLRIMISGLINKLRDSFAPALGADDNYVTDTEKAALHTHSNKTALDDFTGELAADHVTETTTRVFLTPAEKTSIAGKVSKTADTGSAAIPTGTTTERDATPQAGYFRYNSTIGKFEGYKGADWGSVGGGATGGGADEVFMENGQTVTTDYTITSGKHALTTGPITVTDGITVTIPEGSRWVIL